MKQCYACKTEVHPEASICPACKSELSGLGMISSLFSSLGILIFLGVIIYYLILMKPN